MACGAQAKSSSFVLRYSSTWIARYIVNDVHMGIVFAVWVGLGIRISSDAKRACRDEYVEPRRKL